MKPGGNFEAFLVVTCVLLGVIIWQGARRVKVAKMHSQCSILATEIRQARDEQGGSFELRRFLDEYDAAGLFERNQDGDLVDVWGTPFYFVDGAVQSAGRDGVLGTDDDCPKYISRAVLNVKPETVD